MKDFIEKQDTKMPKTLFITFLFYIIVRRTACVSSVNPKLFKVWGPGLQPDVFVMPARYFFIQAVDNNKNKYLLSAFFFSFNYVLFNSINSSLSEQFEVQIEGQSKVGRVCRSWTNILDRKDGSYIIRYKLYESCKNLIVNVKYKNQHVGDSPYVIKNDVQPEDCFCPTGSLEKFLSSWDCKTEKQLIRDLSLFEKIDWSKIRDKVDSQFFSRSLFSLNILNRLLKNTTIQER